MLRELVDASVRLRKGGKLGFPGYDKRRFNWIIDLDSSEAARLEGPYTGRRVPHDLPTRYRSGKIGPTNLKPYLLWDDARYALGIAPPGEEQEVELAHGRFVENIREAFKTTGDADLARVLSFLEKPVPADILGAIDASHWVVFRCGGNSFPHENAAVASCWASILRRDLAAPSDSACVVCGQSGPVLQTMPAPVTIMGQNCQIASFNQTSFRSFGKEQLNNSPICFDCAMGATQALTYFIDSEQHHVDLVRSEKNTGRSDVLRNQLAVFWMKPLAGVSGDDSEEIDTDDLLGQVQATLGTTDAPAPDAAQIEALLRVPWKGNRSSLVLDQEAFCLAVLSANKGRLAVREWMTVSLGGLVRNLSIYLRALRIVDPGGSSVRTFPMLALLDSLETADVHLVRGLLRCAYKGTPPPEGLLAPAVQLFRVPRRKGGTKRESQAQYDERIHRLVATMKLALFHNTEEAESMEMLDREVKGDKPEMRAYNCGRLLAVLEEAQRRASRGGLNSTLVDRYYGGASTTPALTLGSLIRLAETAHFPKLRKTGGGAEGLHQTMQEIVGHFGSPTDLPTSLGMRDQAAFAIGYYHQRAVYRSFGHNRSSEPVAAPESGHVSRVPSSSVSTPD